MNQREWSLSTGLILCSHYATVGQTDKLSALRVFSSVARSSHGHV